MQSSGVTTVTAIESLIVNPLRDPAEPHKLARMQNGMQLARILGVVAVALLVLPHPTPAQNSAPPAQIDVLVQFIEVPRHVDTGTLLTENPVGEESTARIVDHLLKKRKGTLITAPRVLAWSGETGVVDMSEELRYPSDYALVNGSNRIANASANDIAFGAVPTAFETRKVGTVMRATPTLQPGSDRIDLELDVAYVSPPTWKDYGTTVMTRSGEAVHIPINQPFFHSRNITTTLSLYDRSTVIMGDMIVNDGRQLIILVTARVVPLVDAVAPEP